MLPFKNLTDVLTHFAEDKVCREFFEELRWKGNPVCPHCGQTKPYRLKDGRHFRCRSVVCKKNFSVTVGTIFENTKVHLSKWIATIYLLTANKKGISSYQLARHLGITQKTAWFLLHRTRLLMKEAKVVQLDSIVEVDETYIGGKWEHMHARKRERLRTWGIDNKVPVMGLLQRDGQAKLVVIGKNTFKDVVREHVDRSAVIFTDTHSSYNGLKSEFAGHDSVNHSEGEYTKGIVHTNTVEGFFSHFKRTIIGTYHQVSPKHLQRYCDESSYRYNTRQIRDVDRFIAVLSDINGRLKYADLIKKAG